MKINIKDLQPLGEFLRSDNNNVIDNLRELSAKELRISGGGKTDLDDDEYFYTTKPGDRCIAIAASHAIPPSVLYKCPKE